MHYLFFLYFPSLWHLYSELKWRFFHFITKLCIPCLNEYIFHQFCVVLVLFCSFCCCCCLVFCFKPQCKCESFVSILYIDGLPFIIKRIFFQEGLKCVIFHVPAWEICLLPVSSEDNLARYKILVSGSHFPIITFIIIARLSFGIEFCTQVKP